MATEFTLIRVERETLQKLERMRERFLNGQGQRRSRYERDNRGRFSLDKVILYLIQEIDYKTARNERYRERKRGANGKAAK